jgi:hypothetical protein
MKINGEKNQHMCFVTIKVPLVYVIIQSIIHDLSIFEVKHHFVRKLVAQKDLQIIFCGIENMRANVLTKSLGKIKHLPFKNEFKVHENINSTSTSFFLEEKITLSLSNIKFN